VNQERFVIFGQPTREGLVSGALREALLGKMQGTGFLEGKAIEPFSTRSSLYFLPKLGHHANDKAHGILDNLLDSCVDAVRNMNAVQRENSRLRAAITPLKEFITNLEAFSSYKRDIDILNALERVTMPIFDLDQRRNSENAKSQFSELKFLSAELFEGILGKFDEENERFESTLFVESALRCLLKINEI
jgi:hypothetical protein